MESPGASSPDGPLATEVHHIVIESERGAVIDEVPLGVFLALGRSLANPGYGAERSAGLKEMLSTFGQVPNYSGGLQGYNESVEDELWAFVFGTDRATLPLPESAETAIAIYRRVS